METLYKELHLTLKEQLDTIKIMTDLARKHSRALCQLDMKILKDIIKKEEEVAESLKNQEKIRIEIVSRLGKLLGYREDEVLSSYANNAPKYLRKPLSEILTEMAESMRELSEVNVLNNLLTKQAMGVNEMILNEIKNIKEQFYTPKGEVEGKNSVSFLDAKA